MSAYERIMARNRANFDRAFELVRLPDLSADDHRALVTTQRNLALSI